MSIDMEKDWQLIFKDLCGRLPYGVKCNVLHNGEYIVKELTGLKNHGNFDTEFKPYLFPMSSMTEEQEEEYLNTCNGHCDYYWTYETIDWLNEHHFDYRGLIDKGFAIDATNLNIYE